MENKIERLRHYGKYRNEEVIVIGYNRGQNAVMICRVGALPGDEQMELRRIASSHAAQNQDYLVSTLQGERHKSGTDWFTYIANRLRRNDGSVLSPLPIKEVEEMNPDQVAFFKGYGTSVLNRNAQAEMAAQQNQQIPQAHVDMPEGVVETPPAAPAQSDTNPALMALLQQMVEGQQAMQKSMEDLAKKVSKPQRKAPARKKASAKKSTAKKAEPAPAETAPAQEDEGVTAAA